MDEEVADELRRLQARAYGPDADIAGDDAAIARLRELEALATAPPAPAVAASPAAAPTGPAAPLPTPATAEATTAEAHLGPRPESEAPATAPASAPRRPRRLALVWGSSLALVAVLVSGLTLAISGGLRAGADGPHPLVARLDLDRTIDTPTFLGSGRGRTDVFEDFEGLTAMTAPSRRADRLDRCLVILRSDSLDFTADFITGPAFSGCGTDEFPLSLSLRVTSEMPDSIRDLYPDGTALRFVLDDSEVRVYAAAPND